MSWSTKLPLGLSVRENMLCCGVGAASPIAGRSCELSCGGSFELMLGPSPGARQVAQGWVWFDLQGWRLHSLSGQAVQVLDHPYCIEDFLVFVFFFNV